MLLSKSTSVVLFEYLFIWFLVDCEIDLLLGSDC